MEDYLTEQLIKNNEVKVLYLSHNSFCSYAMTLGERFQNCKIYTDNQENKSEEQKDIDYDFIILYSTGLFNESLFNDIRNLASKIVNLNKKRVTIGYSYNIPREKRIESNISKGILTSSFYNGVEIQNIDQGNSNFNPLDLINTTMIFHNELEITKKNLLKK